MKARQTACRGRAAGFGTSSSEKTPTTPAAPRHGSRFLETSAMMKRACAIALTFTLAACGSPKTPTTPFSTATERITLIGIFFLVIVEGLTKLTGGLEEPRGRLEMPWAVKSALTAGHSPNSAQPSGAAHGEGT